VWGVPVEFLTGQDPDNGLGITQTTHRHERIVEPSRTQPYPHLDPDRASFTTALHAARDQLLTAHGINPTGNDTADRLGAIGRAVLATLLPARRLRSSNRNVTCPTSRYHARDDGRPALSTGIVALDIAVHTPPLHPTLSVRPLHPFRHRPPAPSTPNTPPVPTRRQLVTAILLSEPRHDWHGWELTEKLHIKQHNLLTQLSEWARLGFIRRTGAGTYALDTACPLNHAAKLTHPPLPDQHHPRRPWNKGTPHTFPSPNVKHHPGLKRQASGGDHTIRRDIRRVAQDE
jgi:hypothetical protein